MPRISVAVSWLLALVILLPGHVIAGLPPNVFTDGGYLVSRDDRTILGHNENRLLIPASTWKIATGLMALDQLGPDYRFRTKFYLAGDHFYIKGFGDPLLTSEEVKLITASLAASGITEIDDIVVDDSFFQLERTKPDGSAASLRSHDAANGALVVNFNTAKIEVLNNGTVRSAEAQTPSLPVMQELAADLDPGIHRVNLSQNPQRSRRYCGELFKNLLTASGIKVNGEVRSGVTPAGAELVYRHHSSRKLAETVEAMLLYSNNFIANQLFLIAGARQRGEPATWDKGRRNMDDYLHQLGLDLKSFRVEEGSGLSRENRITPGALQQVLERFRPYAELLPHWDDRLVKSGTLNRVYAYAGYFRGNSGLDPFVLILNQTANTRDRALDLMEKRWQHPSRTAGQQ